MEPIKLPEDKNDNYTSPKKNTVVVKKGFIDAIASFFGGIYNFFKGLF